MNRTVILLVITVYFSVLLLISHQIGKRHSENDAFFLGNKKSPWWLVAFGMIGSSLSGVTFVSVPGMVRDIDMTYLQMVFGFLLGYAVIAFILLPLYYRLNLTSIYTYLGERIGRRGYKTGASFFLLARTIGAAARLYIAILILQTYVFDHWNIPFELTSCIFLTMIWLYTFRSGVKTIVWTDMLQTFCLLTALALIIWQVMGKMQLDIGGVIATIRDSAHFRIFVFDDWFSKQHFVKQFLSGIFVTIAMTGIDQEMMQKNLSCKNIRDARKNMCWYGFSFVPVNFLFLCLGVLLMSFAASNRIALPALSDDILPMLVTDGYLGNISLVFFIIGIIAVTFSSADSALTGLTTSFCIDMLEISKYPEAKAKRIRIGVHLLISLLFITIILILRAANNSSIIDTIYMVASYTYGPLLGLFAFGLITKRNTRDRWTPYLCCSAPLLCYALDRTLQSLCGYKFGYEILIINAGLVVIGLFLLSLRR
ncbi:MAG: sodium:solute symporter [Dysgonamonadaceae bacterium]|nr:sodium:solute symporter [Dysgonamonadaceae bacterium]